ncbi:MAG: PH domain-containing protein [Candidatus Saccharimonadales bacterium]
MVKESEHVYWHGKLPIGKDEKILAIYRHHWFVYVQIWSLALFAMLAIAFLASLMSSSATTTNGATSPYRQVIIAATALFAILAGLFALIPTWLKSQERLILTEESLLQVLQPGIFANKVSQVGLQHVNDVSVRQGFFGHMFNFGGLTVETPGEQQNYIFPMVSEAQLAAREIIEAHESYDAALQGGRVPTTYGSATELSAKPVMQVDQQQYEEFLAFKQAMEAQKTAESRSDTVTTAPVSPPSPSEQYSHQYLPQPPR